MFPLLELRHMTTRFYVSQTFPFPMESLLIWLYYTQRAREHIQTLVAFTYNEENVSYSDS